MEDILINCVKGLFAFVGIWIFGIALWVLIVMVPVMMYTEAQCLRNGYPKYNVSVGLERYCSNLTGTITVQVDKAEERSK